MIFDMHKSHRFVFWAPALLYSVLVLVVAVIPAISAKDLESKQPKPETSELVAKGRELYLSYNCVCCHSQQIRGDWHKRYKTGGGWVTPVLTADAIYSRQRASDAKDYLHQDPPLLGTQRTGPDLTNVGDRLPGAQWHYWHLYDPRSVSPDSIMPPYRFLFTTEEPPASEVGNYDRVDVIDGLGVKGGKLWAKPEAKALVEYLLDLRNKDPSEETLGTDDGTAPNKGDAPNSNGGK